MNKLRGPAAIAALMSFNGGFVDTATFLGLQGLFVAHVTGNFVTLGAALVSGTHGYAGKLLALPEFVIAIALARLAGGAMRARGLPALRILLAVEVACLTAFCVIAIRYGPFPDADSPVALAASLAGVAAMALQNGVHRVHLADLPPTTLMTGSTTQATIDAVDLLVDRGSPRTAATQSRFRRLTLSILYFALGCAAAALLYWQVGFWCLTVPVAVSAATALMRTDGDP